MKRIVCQFLAQHHNQDKPLLLALSGGADSLALLWILNDLKKELPLKFSVAHVDHCWRPSSTEEAEKLKNLVESLQIPFHLKALDPTAITGNIENACREERLNYFRELCLEHGYQAVLLGHHADDQAETVLKRLFEGAGLTALGALRQIQEIHGIQLWRPLLSIPKKEIVKWGQARSLTPIDDYTNRDIRFTRAKFREQIIPSLSQQFGKEISPSLNRLGKEALALSTYLDQQVARYYSQIVEGPFGVMLDLQNCSEIPSVELKHLIGRFLKCKEISLSYEEVEMIVEFMLEGKANRQIRSEKSGIKIDRKRLFLLNNLCDLFKSHDISFGQYNHNQWRIDVSKIEAPKQKLPNPSDWLGGWNGDMHVTLPIGEYTFALGAPNVPYLGSSSMGKIWNDAKVPAFLRNILPVIMSKGTVVHEFLSGKQKTPLSIGSEAMHITIKFKGLK